MHAVQGILGNIVTIVSRLSFYWIYSSISYRLLDIYACIFFIIIKESRMVITMLYKKRITKKNIQFDKCEHYDIRYLRRPSFSLQNW